MIESQQVQEWMAMAEAETLLEVLITLFPPGAPADLESAIRATTNLNQLRNWLLSAVKAESLDAFRQAAGV